MNFEELKTELNLSAIGIAPAHDLGEEYARLLDWLSHGYHGNMAWLAKSAKKRCDPAHVLAEPKSVIVCAMKYEDMPDRVSLRARHSTKLSASAKQSPAGDCHVAPTTVGAPRNDMILPKYLRHEDYHVIMMQKLEAVAQALEAEHPDMRYKCYVDTGPVLEKAWGVHAGIGFIGKNTLLISPEHGSQMALGVVVTSVSLRATSGSEAISSGHLSSGDCHAPLCGASATTPSADRRNDNTGCGTCTACLDACPTKALVAPYILDARKCISYKFFIEKQQNGCDVCQDVCPFNKENSHG